MSWEPTYCSVDDLKDFIGSGVIEDTNDDANLLIACTAASRAIDHHCGRQFGVLETAAARYYEARPHRRLGRWVVVIDDLMTTTDLVIKSDDGSGAFATTLTLNTDVRLYPWNAAADNRPWTMLVAGLGATLPWDLREIEVTAKWGWTAVPDVVSQAALIQAERFFKRKDAPFGVAGSPEAGSEMRLLAQLDPDVMMLVDSVRRWVIV